MMGPLRLCLLEVSLGQVLTLMVAAWSETSKHRPAIFNDDISTELICQQAFRYYHNNNNHNNNNTQTDKDDDNNDDNNDDGDDGNDHGKISELLATGVSPEATVNVFCNNFTAGQSVKVSVSSVSSFAGLLLQGRWKADPGEDNRTAGRFRVSETFATREGSARAVTCAGEDDTLIAWFNQGSFNHGFLWTPPVKEPDRVQFTATVFLSTGKTVTNTTVAHRIQGFSAIDHSTCGDLKGCFRYASKKKQEEDEEEDEEDEDEEEDDGGTPCDVHSCQYLLTYRVEGTEARFEMSGRAGWVAVGFSSDDKMGGDDVFMCIRNQRQRVEVRRYLTELRHQMPTLVDRHPFYDVETEAGEGGRISCRFSRPLTVRFDQTSVDLNAPWFQLYAWGSSSMGDSIMMHSVDKPPTSGRKLTLRHSRNEIRHAGSTGNKQTTTAPCAVAAAVAAALAAAAAAAAASLL